MLQLAKFLFIIVHIKQLVIYHGYHSQVCRPLISNMKTVSFNLYFKIIITPSFTIPFGDLCIPSFFLHVSPPRLRYW